MAALPVQRYQPSGTQCNLCVHSCIRVLAAQEESLRLARGEIANEISEELIDACQSPRELDHRQRRKEIELNKLYSRKK